MSDPGAVVETHSAVPYAVIGGVLALLVFAVICVLIVTVWCSVRQKGDQARWHAFVSILQHCAWFSWFLSYVIFSCCWTNIQEGLYGEVWDFKTTWRMRKGKIEGGQERESERESSVTFKGAVQCIHFLYQIVLWCLHRRYVNLFSSKIIHKLLYRPISSRIL